MYFWESFGPKGPRCAVDVDEPGAGRPSSKEQFDSLFAAPLLSLGAGPGALLLDLAEGIRPPVAAAAIAVAVRSCNHNEHKRSLDDAVRYMYITKLLPGPAMAAGRC